MPRLHASARAILCAAATLLFDPGEAAACSVCLAGDPSFSATGASHQQPGDVSLYTEFRTWRKTSGALPHGDGEEDHEALEINDSSRLDVYLSWTPLDRVTLTADVPVAFNDITEHEGAESQQLTNTGLGDVALLASAVLWRSREVLPDTWIEGRAMLKTPTGESSETIDGVRDPHLQAGTGSWDFGFGVAGTHRFQRAALYASGFYRVNGEGSLDYRYGDVILGNLGVEVPLGHALAIPRLEPLVPGFELNFRYSERDEFEGARYPDSGGTILFATPSLRVRLPDLGPVTGVSIRGAVQVPLTNQWLNGFQDEDPVYSAGLLVPF